MNIVAGVLTGAAFLYQNFGAVQSVYEMMLRIYAIHQAGVQSGAIRSNDPLPELRMLPAPLTKDENNLCYGSFNAEDLRKQQPATKDRIFKAVAVVTKYVPNALALWQNNSQMIMLLAGGIASITEHPAMQSALASNQTVESFSNLLGFFSKFIISGKAQSLSDALTRAQETYEPVLKALQAGGIDPDSGQVFQLQGRDLARVRDAYQKTIVGVSPSTASRSRPALPPAPAPSNADRAMHQITEEALSYYSGNTRRRDEDARTVLSLAPSDSISVGVYEPKYADGSNTSRSKRSGSSTSRRPPSGTPSTARRSASSKRTHRPHDSRHAMDTVHEEGSQARRSDAIRTTRRRRRQQLERATSEPTGRDRHSRTSRSSRPASTTVRSDREREGDKKKKKGSSIFSMTRLKNAMKPRH